MSKEIELTQGKVAIVDDEDFEWLSQWKWKFVPRPDKRSGYAQTRFKDPDGRLRSMVMHRLILGLVAPEKRHIYTDHIDGDGLNNRRDNLRRCTLSQNQWNYRKVKPKTSRFKGVWFDKSRNKWVAQIKAHRVSHNCGSFDSEEEAARAYNEAAQRLHGRFACLNDVPME